MNPSIQETLSCARAQTRKHEDEWLLINIIARRYCLQNPWNATQSFDGKPRNVALVGRFLVPSGGSTRSNQTVIDKCL